MFSRRKVDEKRTHRSSRVVFLWSLIGGAGGLAGLAWLFVFALSHPALAQFTVDPGFGTTFGLGTRDLEEIVIGIIQWLLGILALIAVVLMIYGGVLWMTSGGNTDQIKKAKGIIANALIGLVIILSAWGIVSYLLNRFADITGASGPACVSNVDCQPGESCCNGGCQSGSCRNGGWPPTDDPFIVKYRSPYPGESAVPLCRVIDVGFSDIVDIRTLTTGSPTSTVRVCENVCGPTDAGIAGVLTSYPQTDPIGFVFEPSNDFAMDQQYQVVLSGGITSLAGEGLGGGIGDRQWTFATGTETDDIPPQVVLTPPHGPLPTDQQGDVCRSALMSATFNEGMNPISFNDQTIYLDDDVSDGSVTGTQALKGWRFSNLGGAPSGNDTVSFIKDGLLAENTTYGLRLYGGNSGQRREPSAIRDLCGNPLDGNTNGGAEGGRPQGPDDFVDSDPSYSPPAPWDNDELWTFTTGTTVECLPEIQSFTPQNEYYGYQSVKVEGEWLDQAVAFEFSNGIDAFSSQCFNAAEDRSDDACFNSKTSSQIQVEVPVGTVTGATSGPLTVVGSFSENASADRFALASPRIGNLGPKLGPPNQFITVVGSNFGTTPGKVYFRLNGQTIEAEFPCASSWYDNKIIIKVPETIAVPSNPRIQVERSDGRRSNLMSFEVVAGDPGPGICNAVPSCANDAGEIVQRIEGERFGRRSNRVEFNEQGAPFETWSENLIEEVRVPNGEHGLYALEVVDVSQRRSNIWPFDIPCGEAPRLLRDAQCDLDIPKYPSPNPADAATEVCRNVVPLALFTEPMDQTTFNRENIALETCNSDSTFDDSSCQSFAGWKLMPHPTDPASGFSVQPLSSLERKTWYKVIVGPDVKSLSGIKMGITESWHFLTQDTDEDCHPSKVTVQPRSAAVYQHPASATYLALGSTPECALLSGGSTDWEIDNPNIGDFSGFQTQYITNDTATVATQGNNPANIGSTTVRPTMSGTQGSATFTFDPNGCQTHADCQTDICGIGTSQCVAGVCTPYIDEISPDSGPIGRPVTLSGCHFGLSQGSQGKVTFNTIDAELVNQCGPGAWTNDQIIVEVPFGIGSNSPVVVTRGGDGVLSNAQNFVRTSDCGGVPIPASGVPLLCSIDPASEFEGNAVSFEGDQFGGGPASNSTYAEFQTVNKVTNPAQYPGGWTDDKVNVNVPVGSFDGNAMVWVEQCPSNGLWFNNQNDNGGSGAPGVQCINPAYPDICITGVTQPPIGYACLADHELPETTQCNVCCRPGDQLGELTCFNQDFDSSAPCYTYGTPPDRGLYCGCTSNNQCGEQLGCGDVGSQRCCVPFPEIEAFIPPDAATNVCRNAVLEVKFSQVMDQNSINIQTIHLDAPSNCPVVEQKSWTQRIASAAGSLLFGRVEATHPVRCGHAGTVESTTIEEAGISKTVAAFTPSALLAPQEQYRLVVEVDPDVNDGQAQGVRSAQGMGVDGAGEDHVYATMTTGDADRICAPTSVEVVINPPGRVGGSDLFMCAGDGCEGDQDGALSGNQHSYTAQAKDRDGHRVQAVYAWTENLDGGDAVNLSPLNQPQALATVNTEQGEEVVQVVATGQNAEGDPMQVSQSVTIQASMCQNPWPDPAPFEDAGSPPPDFNFSTWYCKDALADPSDLTMDFRVSVQGAGGSGTPFGEDDILKQYFFVRDVADPGVDEAIGIRVFENRRLLSPGRWYEANIPEERQGSPSATTVDGYEAVSDGDTLYVAATNFVTPQNQLFNNIYVISLNENPSAEMKIAYGQMVENFIFTLDGMTAKDEIVRDTKRITHLGELADLLNVSYKEKETYPALIAGTFLKGFSNSVWPSWKETLGPEIGKSNLPQDPTNDFEPDCAFDPITCWDDSAHQYQCPADSQVYQYIFQDSIRADLFAKMEFSQGTWISATGQALSYYSGSDPCASGSASCACFVQGDALRFELEAGEVTMGNNYRPQ